MKTITFGLLAFAVSASVFAAPPGVTAADAEHAVIRAAHTFISRNAPDFGGNVHSPCAVDLRGDGLSVTCSGVADETTGGDGDVKVRFSCTGEFNQGHDGLFYVDRAVHCEAE